MIDDTHDALERLSALGRQILEPAVTSLRTAMREVAASQGWHVVTYADFREWAGQTTDLSDPWIVLDPLLEATCDGRHRRFVRLSRELRGEREWVVKDVDVDELCDDLDARVGIVDDAAATGSTIERAIQLLADAGVQVHRVAVCASTRTSRVRIERIAPGIEWKTFVAGDHVAVHLRDACPYLSLSGRRVEGRSAVSTTNGPVALRLPAAGIRHGVWASLYADFRILHSAVQIRHHVAGSLTAALGRTACVDDVPLLGRDVALPVYGHQSIGPETPLSAIA